MVFEAWALCVMAGGEVAVVYLVSNDAHSYEELTPHRELRAVPKSHDHLSGPCSFSVLAWEGVFILTQMSACSGSLHPLGGTLKGQGCTCLETILEKHIGRHRHYMVVRPQTLVLSDASFFPLVFGLKVDWLPNLDYRISTIGEVLCYKLRFLRVFGRFGWLDRDISRLD